MFKHTAFASALTIVALMTVPGIVTAEASTPYAPMMRGDTAATSNGWVVEPAFTVGETVRRYQAPGILDGVGAFSDVLHQRSEVIAAADRCAMNAFTVDCNLDVLR